MNQKTLNRHAILGLAWVVLCGSLCGANELAPDRSKSSSPLNEKKLETILDNRGKFTDSDLTKMLGPPASIEKSDASPMTLLRMDWEEVNRIEVKCKDGVVKTVTGKFAPGLPSRIINYTEFKRLKTGMKANDVLREFFRGWPPKIVKDADKGTATLVYEQYNRFHIHLVDGKVTTATRIWHTDEHLNTPPPAK